MTSELKSVAFKPWVGKHYGYKSQFGIPVMILGESHYSDGNVSDKNITRSFTKKVVKRVIDGGSHKKEHFLRNVEAAFLGPTKDRDKLSNFWKSVVFYNYVQSLVKKGSRPTRKMWQDAQEPFLQVLRWLKPRPRLIAVFGYETWENTPFRGGRPANQTWASEHSVLPVQYRTR